MNSTDNKQTLFKALLILQTIAILVYTYFTIQTAGWNFFGAAYEHLQSMEWKGQFSLDFFCYLLLSALWIMWRSAFSFTSILLAILVQIWGILFFAPYLLFLVTAHKGDLKKVLLGVRGM